MTKSNTRATADVAHVVGRKNLIINGGFDVWQRGTSFSASGGSPIYTADRFTANMSGGSTVTSRQAFTAGQTDVPDNPKYFLRYNCTVGNNNCGIHQRLEDISKLSGQTVTLSFWAKGTNPSSGSFVSSWIQSFGSGGSSSYEWEAANGIVLTSDWQKFTITTTVPSVSGKTIGANNFLWVEVLRQAGTDTGTAAWTADIANVQLELGSVATEFEHRSYGEELALCQRYYQRWSGVSGDQSPIAVVCCRSGGSHSTGPLLFKGTMRGTPTMSYSQASDFQVLLGSGTTYNNLTSIGFADKGTDSCLIMPYIPSTTNNIPGTLRAVSSSAFVAADAEL